jgi:hypothetical protein
MAFLAPALGEVGSAAGSAAGAVGSTLGDVASSIGGLFGGSGGAGAAGGAAGAGAGGAGGLAGGSGALAGLSNIGNAITGAAAPSEAGYLASLGQAVPAGVDLVGPSSTFAGPGFLHGLVQGYLGTAQQLASPSAATSAGTGLGQLFSALGNVPQASMPSSGGLPPVVQLGQAGRGPATQILPGRTAQEGPPNTGPIMALLHDILGGI